MRKNKNKNHVQGIKNYFNDMKEVKRRDIKEILMDLAEIIDAYYPYNFLDSETYLMNPIVDTQNHFIFCVAKLEKNNNIILDNDFIENMYSMFYDKFYSKKQESYNKLIKYLSFLTGSQTTKKDEDIKIYKKLYDSYKYEIEEC